MAYSDIESTMCNITPKNVANELGAKIYYTYDGVFIELNGEVSLLGYNIINMIPWDYDKDGNKDLLVTSWSGSGIHYVSLWAYNTKTKKTENIYGGTAPGGGNLAVTDIGPDGRVAQGRYYVHRVDSNMDMECEEIIEDNRVVDFIWHLKGQSLVDEELLGYVEYKKDEFVYKVWK